MTKLLLKTKTAKAAKSLPPILAIIHHFKTHKALADHRKLKLKTIHKLTVDQLRDGRTWSEVCARLTKQIKRRSHAKFDAEVKQRTRDARNAEDDALGLPVAI